jgi:hypothetical protein
VRLRELVWLGCSAVCVVRRPDGKHLIERPAEVGFHWMRPANAWTFDIKRATKLPRTLAEAAARAHGGVAVEYRR